MPDPDPNPPASTGASSATSDASSAPTKKDPSDNTAELSVVKEVKLPVFLKADPELWFAAAETRFRTHSVRAEMRKFELCIDSLPPEILMDVRDLVLQPPATEPYATLKKELLQRTSDSQQRRLQQLLTQEELGDRKPSQLLRRMQQLAGDQAAANASIIKELFLQRLPHQIRLVLASSEQQLSVEALAKMADSMVDITAFHGINAASSQSQPNSDIATLRQQLDSLSRQLASLQAAIRPRSRSRSRRVSRDRTVSQSPSRTQGSAPDRPATCYYHARFGSRARKCKAPCSFAPQSGNGMPGFS